MMCRIGNRAPWKQGISIIEVVFSLVLFSVVSAAILVAYSRAVALADRSIVLLRMSSLLQRGAAEAHLARRFGSGSSAVGRDDGFAVRNRPYAWHLETRSGFIPGVREVTMRVEEQAGGARSEITTLWGGDAP